MQRVIDQMLQGMGAAFVHIFYLLILPQEPAQFLHVVIKPALRHHGLHMINQGGITAPLGDCAFRRIVGIIDIKMGHIPDTYIRKAGR